MIGLPKKNGFTIVELLFAMTVFSFVLLLALGGIVQVGKMYYKGVTTANVQEATRRVAEEVSQAIQFTAEPISLPSASLGPNVTAGTTPDSLFFCIGSKRYSVAIDRELSDSPSAIATDKEKRHVFWVDQLGQCAGATGIQVAQLGNSDPSVAGAPNNGSNGREILSPGMRVTKLQLQPLDTSNTLWELDITIAYGDEELFEIDPSDSSRKICKGAIIGTQFCAFSEYTTTVKKRVVQ